MAHLLKELRFETMTWGGGSCWNCLIFLLAPSFWVGFARKKRPDSLRGSCILILVSYPILSYVAQPRNPGGCSIIDTITQVQGHCAALLFNKRNCQMGINPTQTPGQNVCRGQTHPATVASGWSQGTTLKAVKHNENRHERWHLHKEKRSSNVARRKEKGTFLSLVPFNYTLRHL